METDRRTGERPRLIDLFCGAGGAAMGYHRAGFDVVGVDVNPQPNYPFTFVRADAMTYPLAGFDAIHASPPCQTHSSITPDKTAHPELVAATRERLQATGVPWVMENVPGSPMNAAVILCGSMFGLGATGDDDVYRQLRRHRLFEASMPIMSPPCAHHGPVIGVYGTGGGGHSSRPSGGGGYKGGPREYREAMGITWATRAEIAQAIPPAYTEHVGGYLMAAVMRHAAALPSLP